MVVMVIFLMNYECVWFGRVEVVLGVESGVESGVGSDAGGGAGAGAATSTRWLNTIFTPASSAALMRNTASCEIIIIIKQTRVVKFIIYETGTESEKYFIENRGMDTLPLSSKRDMELLNSVSSFPYRWNISACSGGELVVGGGTPRITERLKVGV